MNGKAESTGAAEHPALQVLRAFFTEMNAWQAEMIRLGQLLEREGISDDDSKKSQRKKLEEIFERYCEAGRRAKPLKDYLYYPAEEPDYDPVREQIVSVTEKGGKVVVQTQQTHSNRWKMKYELVKTDAGWKVRDNRKSSFDFETRWTSWHL